MPHASLDRTLTAALPWLAAFVIGAAAHVSVVREFQDRHLVTREAPLVDVDIDLVLTSPARADPAGPDATVFTIDPTCTGEIEPPLAPELLFGIRQLGPTQFQLDRHALDVLLDSRPDPRLRLVPAVQGGYPAGLKLFGVRSCSPLGLLGLRNGDLLVRVNGRPVHGGEPSLAAYRDLRGATTLTIDVIRHGQPLSLVYAIA